MLYSLLLPSLDMGRKKLEKKIFDYRNELQNLIIGSMIAFCFIILPILPTLYQHKKAAHIASFSFALSIPTLIFYLFIKRAFLLSKSKNLPISCILMVVVGIFSAVTGLLSIIYYVLPEAAAVSLIVGTVCFIIYFYYEEKMVWSELRKKEQSQEKLNKIYTLRKVFLGKINKILFRKIKAF